MSRLSANSFELPVLIRQLAIRGTMLTFSLLAACSGDSATGPLASGISNPGQTSTPTAAPTITLTAQSWLTNTGAACLMFYAKATEDLTIFTGKISDPLDRTYRVDPASGQSFVLGQGLLARLQPVGVCYAKVSGTYTFTFTGSRASGGAFTATVTYVQGAV